MSDMPKRLVVEIFGGNAAPAELPQQGKLVVGGSKDKADLVLSGQGVADVHCAIGRIKGGGWALKDMGSEFGTLVNGKRASSARLAAGDTIQLGSVRLRVFDPARPETKNAQPAASTHAPPAPRKAAPKAAAPKAALKAAPKPAPKSANRAQSIPQIAGYDTARLLGRGGMGEVYLAEQTSLARQVALKVLSPKLEADKAFVQQFQAEARAAAALNHPNVVTVFDVGEHDGHHYLSMEFMDAGCLESRLANLGPIPWREALTILRDAASGLEYAESRGIVHRDIKPANLMQNQDGVTKLADLGLAVASDDELSSAGNKVVGTPHFIAPELLRGQAADHRSDLYSLGATAFRILSGHTPFEGETTKDILRGALNDEPEALCDIVPGLPVGVGDMVSRLLAKEPDARHPSAAVLVHEIERLRTGQPVGDAPAAKSPSAVPKLVGAAVVVVGLGIAAMQFGGDDPEDVDPNPVAGTNGGPNGTDGTGETGGSTPTEVTDGGPQETDAPTDVDSPTEGPGGQDTIGAEAWENKAKVAYYELRDRSMSDDDRIAALRALAKEYLGTDTAREADAEADTIRDRTQAAAAVDAAHERHVQEVLANLRKAAALDSPTPRPGDALRAIVAVDGQEDLKDDEAFQAQRAALIDEVLDRALTYARAQWDASEVQAAEGDFDGVQTTLRDLLPMFDLPEFTPETEPEQVPSLAQIRLNVRARLDKISTDRDQFIRRRAGQDDAAIATGLGGAGGLEAELRSFDFQAASARLQSMVGKVTTADARARLETVQADLAIAGTALNAIGEAWGAGEWKRRSLRDPRGSKSDATNADKNGVMLAGGNGASQVPWSAWCGKTARLDNVFKGRLTRPWTSEESASIAALMRVSAIIEAVDLASQLLRQDSGQSAMKFSDRESQDMLAAFDVAASWAAESGSEEAVQRERAAAELLGSALRATSDEAWTRAVTLIERLLDEHRGSLLVLLLSDGTPAQD
ncbi:MAG: protein kinase [bacterium]|nr:protein kinase [bacterium]